MQNNPPGGINANGQVPAHVLVVDDDPTVAEVVAGYLDRAGHDVERAADGPSALAHFARRRPDLVVLDLMLPGMDGFEVCRRMREQDGPIPVIMLTARGDEEDRVLGLETGADDYVTKPFSPRELVLRVESVLRRARASVPAPGSSPAVSVLRTATLTLDPTARRATREGVELALTLREFDLLAFFLRHPGRAFSREELMSEVWGWDFGDLSTVTVHVRRLRAKIENDPASPRLIQTVWGVGYRLSETTAESAVLPIGNTAGPAAPPASESLPPAPPGPAGKSGPADSPPAREGGAASARSGPGASGSATHGPATLPPAPDGGPAREGGPVPDGGPASDGGPAWYRSGPGASGSATHGPATLPPAPDGGPAWDRSGPGASGSATHGPATLPPAPDGGSAPDGGPAPDGGSASGSAAAHPRESGQS